jgi:hypothetical protein
MAAKFVIVCALVMFSSSVLAFPGYNHHDHDYYDHPRYSFNYGVQDHSTGDIKHQSEFRDGDVVKGSYSLVEPDGSIRTVDYTADDVNGFNAVVHKTAPTVHKAAVIAKPIVHKPIYHKPIYQVQAPIVPVAPVAPIAYKAYPSVAKTAQYTHHVPQINHYADYSDIYTDGHGHYGHYY